MTVMNGMELIYSLGGKGSDDDLTNGVVFRNYRG